MRETAQAHAGGRAAHSQPTIAGSENDGPAPFDHSPGAQRSESSHSITLVVITSDCTRLAPHRGPSSALHSHVGCGHRNRFEQPGLSRRPLRAPPAFLSESSQTNCDQPGQQSQPKQESKAVTADTPGDGPCHPDRPCRTAGMWHRRLETRRLNLLSSSFGVDKRGIPLDLRIVHGVEDNAATLSGRSRVSANARHSAPAASLDLQAGDRSYRHA